MHRSSGRTPGRLGAGLRLAVLLAVIGLCSAAPRAATALTITDLTPLYFGGSAGGGGGGEFGFSQSELIEAGLVPRLRASSLQTWLAAGPASLGLPVSISQQLTTIHANPQADGRRASLDDPLIADSIWTVRNDSGAPLLDAWLVYTVADPSGLLPGVPLGLDGDLMEIVEYSSDGSGVPDYFFGAVALADLGAGQSTSFLVRYVVAGNLLLDSGSGALTLPTLGVSTLLVPEPGTALALGVGLLCLGGARRRSSPASG
ncbi:MAG: PEP-CTERM sorting domain-containing protein [Myxococcota bacterium]|nr:PEP-CTERM sorting domain-containing protein [Myxococcota bacterium]